jgi:hypothetical protein
VTPPPHILVDVAQRQQQAEGGDVTRLERILAYMFASAIGLSIIAIVLVLVSAAVPFQLPAVIAVLPVPGLAIAFGILVALLIVTAVRKGRESRDARS